MLRLSWGAIDKALQREKIHQDNFSSSPFAKQVVKESSDDSYNRAVKVTGGSLNKELKARQKALQKESFIQKPHKKESNVLDHSKLKNDPTIEDLTPKINFFFFDDEDKQVSDQQRLENERKLKLVQQGVRRNLPSEKVEFVK